MREIRRSRERLREEKTRLPSHPTLADQPTTEAVFILRPEGPSLALRSQPAVSDDAFRTHLARAQFHATHAHHADIAHTQNSHSVSSRPPACSHSETNRLGANFHRPRISRPPLLIQPHFADRVSGVVSHRRIHARILWPHGRSFSPRYPPRTATPLPLLAPRPPLFTHTALTNRHSTRPFRPIPQRSTT